MTNNECLEKVIEYSGTINNCCCFVGECIVTNHCCCYNETPDDCENYVVFKRIKEALETEPVRHGKWIKLDMHAHLADHKCTACGQECYVPTCMGEPMYTYCPNCGSRNMEDE